VAKSFNILTLFNACSRNEKSSRSKNKPDTKRRDVFEKRAPRSEQDENKNKNRLKSEESRKTMGAGAEGWQRIEYDDDRCDYKYEKLHGNHLFDFLDWMNGIDCSSSSCQSCYPIKIFQAFYLYFVFANISSISFSNK
jgi:hypothetical protein